jgi:hypothetical protein
MLRSFPIYIGSPEEFVEMLRCEECRNVTIQYGRRACQSSDLTYLGGIEYFYTASADAQDGRELRFTVVVGMAYLPIDDAQLDAQYQQRLEEGVASLKAAILQELPEVRPISYLVDHTSAQPIGMTA